MSGDLGSGKTHFAKGLLSFWRLENEVSSPTFTIVNEHKKDDTNIYHFDVYRLNSPEEFYSIGGPDYFEMGISIIEWGEIIESILPPSHIKVNFEKDLNNENVRYINIETEKRF
ncbi:MAG: tRNA (adenosine(37)-N6)-threonylcarbamoyltransferase complex ATPase subunit type 1 TsaE [Oscillospiraceae bacterium]|nr:tRNA (adenosine(37)-N6)-threonylcarbamoyltransferase complex ATPase subunit type 1 TsaE [Oscillospiraceae bacterium]